ncbi:hypothetical protein MKW92_003661 [Papaver armeniacum]|nr:hypothetical protein MKW92_003661 [Papaver armeniacum]
MENENQSLEEEEDWGMKTCKNECLENDTSPKPDTPGITSRNNSHGSMDAIEAAKSLAKASGAVIAVSGAVDVITDGQRLVGVHNGVAMMQWIKATGCAVITLMAAFVVVDPLNAFEATTSALSIFGVAGELGMDMDKGPASLRMHLIDSLHGLDQATILSRVNISCMSQRHEFLVAFLRVGKRLSFIILNLLTSMF